METDEEVALISGDSETGQVHPTRMNRAGSLRRELGDRGEQYADPTACRIA